MKEYINYSDNKFQKQQKFALFMAKYFGKFDKIIGYGPNDIDKIFYKKYENILKQARGNGYWLWKPYFIYKSLKQLSNGDYLFYSDSGAFFLKNVNVLINELKKYNQDIMGFELPLIEEQWTKKELFINMKCDEDKYYKSNQVLASFMLIRKTASSMKFIRQYLNYSCSEINITDKYNKNIKQVNNFIDHRHDQSIFSLLYKKYNLRVFKDPTQFGKYPAGYAGYPDRLKNKLLPNRIFILGNNMQFRCHKYAENYNLVMFHNRKGRPLNSFLRFKIKELLYKYE